MAGLLFNKFKEDRVRVLLVQELREMLQVQGETTQLVKQWWLSVINQGEWHMARQCTQPKRLRNSAWFKEKMFQAIQTTIPRNAAFLTNVLDAYDSDCDDISSTKAILMANLSSYGLDILYELNKLFENFGKCFVPQMQLSAEQAFWLPLSNPKSEKLDGIQTPVETEVPKELPKCSVDKKYFDIQKKEFSLDNNRLLDHIICQDVMNIVMHADSVPVNVLSANNKCLVNDNIEIEILEKENDHLFELLLSQDIVHICVKSLASRNDCHKMQQSFINEYNKNLVLKVEVSKKEHMV
ncbi:hypothetical protein Tco_0507800 [Tanacetum coccineum]